MTPVAEAPPVEQDEVLAGDPVEDEQPPPLPVRALFAAGLASAAAGLMAAGIFDSWAARLIGAGAAVGGAGWAALVLRARRGRLVLQALLLPAIVAAGAVTLAGAPGGPSELPSLVRDAISGGRLLRPPVPFDPGWGPVLVALFALLGFSTAWLAGAFGRPLAALSLPAGVLALTAVSQPAEAELAGGLIAFVALLGALAVLYRGRAASGELSAGFETRRAARALVFGAGAIALIVGLNDVSWLFPKPLYNPASKPRKPKSVPLSEARDRVLFEIEGAFTGPWRMGVLDVYDGRSWRLPPFDPDALRPAGDGGSAAGDRSDVLFTIRDLGDGAVVPTVPDPQGFRLLRGEATVLIDPRTQIARVDAGRVPAGLVYAWSAPRYPTTGELLALSPPDGFAEMLEIGDPPPAVRDLLAAAPPSPYARMEALRAALFDSAVADGPGTPVDVTPATVQDLLAGSNEGSPFEIVAAEAMLARWAGVPARIGFGFDGTNDESGTKTVRPKNAATWLEVYAPGFGWTPLIGSPKQAKVSLDSNEDREFDPDVLPSDDVAVEIYIPVELENLTALYERIRAFIMRVAPFVLALLAGWVVRPAAAKALRRRRQRRWAADAGPRAAIAVEYAELRDLAADLNVGDPTATPLEFLSRIAEDDEHAELAWLVTRTAYGDLAASAGPGDVEAARELSTSVRRRLAAAQPLQSRVLAALGRASLREPYTLEVPTALRSPGRVATIDSDEGSRPHALVP